MNYTTDLQKINTLSHNSYKCEMKYEPNDPCASVRHVFIQDALKDLQKENRLLRMKLSVRNWTITHCIA